MAVAHDRPSLDLGALKTRQQAMWASGDYGTVASKIVNVAERLCDAADLHAGWRVLDVATGNGNVAIAAARRGCEVVGVDYVPALLDHGRLRADVEGLDVTLLEGDAESLAVPRRELRRSHVGVRRHVRARSAAGCRRAAAGVPARRHDRARELDARRATSARCSARRPRTFRRLRGLPRRSAGGRRTVSRSCSAMGSSSVEVEERTFTFRYPSAEDFVAVLPHVVRTDAQGLREPRSRRPVGARGGARRPRPGTRPRTRRSLCGRRHLPGGDRRPLLTCRVYRPQRGPAVRPDRA